MANPFRKLPSVSQLLESQPLKNLVDKFQQQTVVNSVRGFLDDLRSRLTDAAESTSIPTPAEMAERIAQWMTNQRRPMLQPVINGTGIILHTGLGRAPLAKSALEALQSIAAGYSSLEIDLETGERSQRVRCLEQLLKEVTGAEAVAVANNNAAATMLTLSALAKGREVIVSRGHLIEIGGSYRLPEIMECSGCILKEVGTTNKTRTEDYLRAIGPQTGAILRVHPSNYQIVGFTEAAPLSELVQIAHQHRLPLIDDVGSGALVDFTRFGLRDEPEVPASLRAGADVVLFSGDKLLGGPQAGVIAGKKVWIEKILADPFMRAMRVDKLTLAALQATLELYRQPQQAEQEIPLLAMLATPVANLQFRAQKFLAQIQTVGAWETAEVVADASMLGGGSLPTQKIDTWCAALVPRDRSVEQLAKQLRTGHPAIMGRIHKNQFLIDFRTVTPEQDAAIVNRLQELMGTPTTAAAPLDVE